MINYEDFLKAQELVKKGEIGEAITILRRLHELEPDDNKIMFTLAKFLTKRSASMEEGKTYLEELLNTESRNYALLELAKLEFRIGDICKSRSYLKSLMEYGGRDETFAKFEMGKLELYIGNFDEARKYFKPLMELGGRDRIFAMFEMGRIEAHVDNFNEARKYFEAIINSEERFNKNYALLELAKLEAKANNFDKARELLETVITLGNNRDKTLALIEMGRLEISMENFDEAREYFEAIINSEETSKKNSNKNYALLELAKLEFKANNFDKARELFEIVIALGNRRDRIDAQIEMGRLEASVENFDEARKCFESVIAQGGVNKVVAMRHLLFLNIKRQFYPEAYQLLETLTTNKFMSLSFIKQVSFYLKYQLGILTTKDYDPDSYFQTQVLSYDEKRAISHIQACFTGNDKSQNRIQFNSDIDILELFDIACTQIESTSPQYSSLIDVYIVRFQESIGKFNGLETKWIKVETLMNSKQIISICPSTPNKKKYDQDQPDLRLIK